jgi:hypothetical protein
VDAGEALIRSTHAVDDGGHLLVGWRSGADPVDVHAWIAKVDASGEIAWQRTYRGPGQTAANSATQARDGGFLVVGGSLGGGADDSEAFAVKLDRAGNEVWQKSYRGSGVRGAASVHATADAGFVVAGNSSEGTWLAKLDPSGAIVWQKIYFGVAASRMQPTLDGGYALVGVVKLEASGLDAILFKVGAGGESAWSRVYGGAGTNYGMDVRPTPDGGYLVGASLAVPGAPASSPWIVKTDGNGDVPGCALVGAMPLTAIHAAAVAGAGTLVESGGVARRVPDTIAQAVAAMTPNQDCRFDGAALPANYHGLWWNSPPESEAGWGINLAHQGDVIFATWFTYDAAGKPLWLSLIANKRDGETFAGTLLRTWGPAFSADPFDPLRVTHAPMGTGTLTFSDADNGVFAYTVGGVPRTKPITRQLFGPAPACMWATQATLPLATNYQDMWWAAPPGIESGWGVNITHQGDAIFATWHTYGFDGSALWLAGIAPKTAPGVYSGHLFRTTGPPLDAQPFDPAAVNVAAAGTLRLAFADGNAASFAYTVSLPEAASVTQTKSITRMVFREPVTICR